MFFRCNKVAIFEVHRRQWSCQNEAIHMPWTDIFVRVKARIPKHWKVSYLIAKEIFWT